MMSLGRDNIRENLLASITVKGGKSAVKIGRCSDRVGPGFRGVRAPLAHAGIEEGGTKLSSLEAVLSLATRVIGQPVAETVFVVARGWLSHVESSPTGKEAPGVCLRMRDFRLPLRLDAGMTAGELGASKAYSGGPNLSVYRARVGKGNMRVAVRVSRT